VDQPIRCERSAGHEKEQGEKRHEQSELEHLGSFRAAAG
jgi:hypothetical protein